MTIKTWIRKASIVSAVALVCLWAGGCKSVHQENTRLAQVRWARARAAVQLQLAEQQYKNGQLDKSLVTLGKAMDLDRDFAQLHNLRGKILAEKGQGQAAVAAFELAIALDHTLPEPHYQRGVQFERWGQFDRALECYQSASSLDPTNVSYVVATAEALGQLDRIDQALDLLDRGLQSQEQSVALRVTAGELCLARSDFARAVGYLRDAARLATDDVAILRSLAVALYNSGRYDEARALLNQLLRQLDGEPAPAASADGPPDTFGAEQSARQSRRAALLAALGDCYLAARQLDEARRLLTEATALAPEQAGPWEGLAKVAMIQGRWDQMLAPAERAVAVAPRSVSGHLLRGYALGRLDRPALAVEAFKTAHRLAPTDVLMLCMMAENYLALGDTQSARDALIRAQQIAPSDPLAGRMMDELARSEFVRPDGAVGDVGFGVSAQPNGGAGTDGLPTVTTVGAAVP